MSRGGRAWLAAALHAAALAAVDADASRSHMGISDEEALRSAGATRDIRGKEPPRRDEEAPRAAGASGPGRRELVVKVANSTSEHGGRTNFSVNFSAWVAASSDEEEPPQGAAAQGRQQRAWAAAPTEAGPSRHPAAGADHRGAEPEGGEACSAACELDGVSATCRERIDWARTHIFDEKRDACQQAHELVLHQCRECSRCGLGAACQELAPTPASFGSDPPDCGAEPPLSWDAAQWCCERQGVGCQDLFPAYDCEYGHFDSWSAGKQGWCCAHGGGGGCPEGDGEADRNPDDEGDAKGARTPDRTLIASNVTSDPMAQAFDCFQGLASWQAGWGSEKKAWCCLHHTLGCQQPRARPAQVTAPLVDTGDWTTRPPRVQTTTTTAPSFTTTATATGAKTNRARSRGSSRGSAGRRPPRAAARSAPADASRRSPAKNAGTANTTKRATDRSPTRNTSRSSSTKKAPVPNGNSSATTENRTALRHASESPAAARADAPASAAPSTSAGAASAARASASVKAGTPAASEPFDCQSDLDTWLDSWPVVKAEWCCMRHHVGCPPTVTTTTTRASSTSSGAFDCSWSPAWLGTWSPQRREWCCRHHVHGCASQEEHAAVVSTGSFDCTDQRDLWSSWSQRKAEWCCERDHGVGPWCPDNGHERAPAGEQQRGASPAAATGRYDCREGFFDWKRSWSQRKVHWCCRNGDRAVRLQLERGASCPGAPSEEPPEAAAITEAAAVPENAAGWLLGRSPRPAPSGVPFTAALALAALAAAGAVLGLRRPCGAGSRTSHEGYEALDLVIAELYEQDPLDAAGVDRAAE